MVTRAQIHSNGMCDNWHNNAGAPSFSYTNDLKWTVAILKIVDDIKATNGAFGKILLWAREAASAQYSFYPQGGMSRNKNVENLINSMENAKHLLPSGHCEWAFSGCNSV